jgi:hypothetical protein
MSQTDSPAAGTCPSCGFNLPEGAVLCTNCGLNLKTGERIKTTTGTEAKAERARNAARRREEVTHIARQVLKVVGLVVGLAAGYYGSRAAVKAWRGFGELAQKEGPKFSDPQQDMQRMMHSSGGAPMRPPGYRPNRGPGRDRRQDAIAWAYAKVDTTVEAEFLSVRAPKVIANDLAAALQRSEIWPVLVAALKESYGEKYPNERVRLQARIISQKAPVTADCKRDSGLQLAVAYLPAASSGPLVRMSFIAPPRPVPTPVASLAEIPGEMPDSVQNVVFTSLGQMPRVVASLAAVIPAATKRVLPQAEQWLADGTPAHKFEACCFYAATATKQQEMIETLGELVRGRDDHVRYRALELLCEQADAGVPEALTHIVSQVGHPDPYTGNWAMQYVRRHLFSITTMAPMARGMASCRSEGRVQLMKYLLSDSKERRRFARDKGMICDMGLGEVAVAAIAAEQDPKAKQEIAELMYTDVFIANFSMHGVTMQDAQLVACLQAPSRRLSVAAAGILKERAKTGRLSPETLESLHEVLATGRGPGAWSARGVLGAFALTGRQPAHTKAMRAYIQGWRSAAMQDDGTGWRIETEDAKAVAALVQNYPVLLEPMLQCFLLADNPLPATFIPKRTSQPAQGQPSGPGALLLLMDWAHLDQRNRLAGTDYLMQGIRSQIPKVSLEVSRVVLSFSRYYIISKHNPKPEDAALGRCVEAAKEVMLRALDSPDLRTRRQAVWMLIRKVPHEALVERFDVICETTVKSVEQMLPGDRREMIRELSAPFYYSGNKFHDKYKESLAEALAGTDLPADAYGLLD